MIRFSVINLSCDGYHECGPESIAGPDSGGEEFDGSGRIEKREVEIRDGEEFPEGRDITCM